MKQAATEQRTIILVFAALLTLVVAAALEYGIWRLHIYAGRTFESWPLMWLLTLGPLLLAVLFMGLAWLTLRTTEATRLAGVLLLVLGLPSAFVLQLSRLGVPGRLLGGLSNVVIGDYYRFTGAFLSVLGLYLILQRNPERS